MTFFTPGVAFLAQRLTYLSIPGVLIYAVAILSRHLGNPDVTWQLIALFTCALPAAVVIRRSVLVASWHREAETMGARLAPWVRGKWLGNVDVLSSLMEKFEHGYPADGLYEIAEEYGPAFELRFLWMNAVFTTEPQHIKAILASDFSNFVKGEKFQSSMSSVLGSGVFNSDGDMWKFHRSMTRPFFSRDRISHFDLFDRHAESAIKKVKERLRAGYAVDFQDVMSRFTLDTATEFLLGSCVHSLSSSLPYPHNAIPPPNAPVAVASAADDFARAFAEAQFVIAQRERWGDGVWQVFEIFKDRSAAPMKIVNAYLEPIIKEAIEKQKLRPVLAAKADVSELQVEEDDTVLDYLVRQTSDPVLLKDETLNIMIAGRDTTAATMTFVFYLLATHPHVTARLREEVLTKVGPGRRPTYDDMRELKYLRAVINETLRLYPTVPFDVRESIHATTWPSSSPLERPMYIPAKTKTPYSVFMMHRRKDLWGPDAEIFDPDRFLDERLHKYLTPSPFIFLPFNAGPRICLGQQFAYNEMSFMIVRLLQNFSSVALDLDAQPPASMPPAEWRMAAGRKGVEQIFPKMHLTLYANGGLWVKMQEVNKAN